MIVVDKGKTLKVSRHYSFFHLAEWLAELIANTITAVSRVKGWCLKHLEELVATSQLPTRPVSGTACFKRFYFCISDTWFYQLQ